MAMFVSFIIPCYNVEKYIAACLDSVLIQKVDAWEAICVNDGSKGGTLAILEAYARKDSRIKVISQRNGGLSAARNTALKIAQGEWLYYLDSDDVIAPWALEEYLKAAQAYPQADLINARKINVVDFDEPQWQKPEMIKYVLEDISSTVGRSPFTGFFPQFLYKREIVGTIPFVGDSWCEERPYVAKVIARCRLIVWCDFDAYGYRIRSGSICQSGMTLSQCIGYLEATHVMLQELTASGKVLTPGLLKLLYIVWLETTACFIVEKLPKGERSRAWMAWFRSLSDLRHYQPPTRWLRFALATCQCFPFRITAGLLCVLPHKLKRSILPILRHRK